MKKNKGSRMKRWRREEEGRAKCSGRMKKRKNKKKTIQEKWGKKGTKETRTEEEKKQARKKVEEGRSC